MVVSRGLTRRARRTWVRIERRARRAHERDLLDLLRELGREQSPVVAIELPRRGRCIISIALVDRQIVLAGVSERALAIAAELAGGQSGMSVVDGGRYRSGWWLTVNDDTGPHHILGVYLQIVPHGRPGSATPAGQSPWDQAVSPTADVC